MQSAAGSLAGKGIIIDTTTPTVTAVGATTPNGTYGLGKVIAITVAFSEPVVVNTSGGTPTLTLNDGGSAGYSGGSGSSTLTFTYTVAAGQNVSRLDVASTTALATNGGSIADQFGNPAIPTLSSPGGSGSLGANTKITIDTVAPFVTGVTSTTANGDYTVGKVITILVSFSEPVVVSTANGTPTLALNSGGGAAATYTAGNGSSTLSFTYTVAAGQNASKLDAASTAALTLNGGTIVNLYGNPANLTLPTPGAPGSLSANTAIQIDTTAPVITGVSSASPNGTYGTGANILILVTFSEPVSLVGNSAGLILNYAYPTPYGPENAYAWCYSEGVENVQGFTLQVPAGGYVDPLDELSTGSMEGAFVDVAGNIANVTLPAPGAAKSLAANSQIVIDALSPTVTGLSSPDANESFGPGQVVPVTISFNTPVFVNTSGGTPTLALNDGGTAVYSGGSGTRTLSFNYTVTNPQYALQLDAASSTALSLNGATIQDSLGNTANPTLPAPGAAGSLGASAHISILNDDDLLVRRLYQVFLGRNGAPSEVIGWGQQVPTLGQGQVAYDIAHSTESLTDIVTQAYWTVLDRAPDPNGLSYWVEQMQDGATREVVMADMASSPEFLDDAGNTVGGFVTLLYERILGRAPDSGGYNYWVAYLQQHPGAYYQVADAFVTGTEYRTDQVGLMYQDFLDRTGAASEIAGWVNSGLDLLSIEVAIASSPEFWNDAIQGKPATWFAAP